MVTTFGYGLTAHLVWLLGASALAPKTLQSPIWSAQNELRNGEKPEELHI